MLRICLTVLALVPAIVVEAQGIRYAPFSGRYEQTIVTKGSGNLGAAAGGAGGAALEITQYYLFSVVATALRGDSLKLVVTIDSSSLYAPMLGNQSGSSLPRGTKFERTISVLGNAARDTEQGGEAEAMFAGVFPAIIAGARVGTAWPDTAELSIGAGQGLAQGLQGKINRTIMVAADTNYGGVPAWKMQSGSDVVITGSAGAGGAARARAGGAARGGRAGGGAAGGGAAGATRARAGGDGAAGLQLSAEGSGEGTGVLFLSKAGELLYATETISLNANITIGQGGFSIPIETSTVRTVRKLR